jgi:hypothetical protein
MKKIVFVVFITLVFGKLSFGQCDKKITWQSTKSEFLDAAGKVQNTREDSLWIETGTKDITVNHANVAEDQLKGTIKEVACNWSEPFKNGKTIIKAAITDASGNGTDGVLTIEGKEGDITITLSMDNMQGKQIRIFVNKFQEKI